MDEDFWNRAFGGKDMLCLYLDAYDFEYKVWEYFALFKFKYGEDLSVSIDCYDSGLFVVKGGDSEVATSTWYIREIPEIISNMTGRVLNCFD